MSRLAEIDQAVADELNAEVEGLSLPEGHVHLHAAWDPEFLNAAVGERHLAVFPVTEGAHILATGALAIEPALFVMVWEGADTEASRLRLNERKTAEFLDLHEAIRARFLVYRNETLGGVSQLQYQGVEFPQVPGPTRWMRIVLRTEYALGFTP